MLSMNDPPVESPQIWLVLPLHFESHPNVFDVYLIVFPQIQTELLPYLQNKDGSK